MTPLTLPSQTALETRVSVGYGTPVWAYHDYWGTGVSSLTPRPRTTVTVRSHAMVETSTAPPPPPPLAWDELRGQAEAGMVAEYLAATPGPPWTLRWPGRPGTGARRPRGRRRRRGLGQGAGGVHARGHRGRDERPGGLGQEPGSLPGHRAPDRRPAARGGPPARYVSGYLHPRPEAGLGQAVTGQSHAWVEYWAGDWVGADPTNRASVGEGHVVVARGRDYGDVPPLKGNYHGAPSVAMDMPPRPPGWPEPALYPEHADPRRHEGGFPPGSGVPRIGWELPRKSFQ